MVRVLSLQLQTLKQVQLKKKVERCAVLTARSAERGPKEDLDSSYVKFKVVIC